MLIRPQAIIALSDPLVMRCDVETDNEILKHLGAFFMWGTIMRRITISCLVYVFTCSLAAASSSGTYLVSVSQIVKHPALDAVRKGFTDYLEENGFEVKYNVHIAQGSHSNNTKIAGQISVEDPDLILTISTPSSQACAKIIKGKTILFAAVTDPVGAGLVKSLDMPGANITGTTDMSPIDRHIALIREIHPSIGKLGVIYNPKESNSVTLVNMLRSECARCNIAIEEATTINAEGVSKAAIRLKGKCDAMYVPADNTVVSRIESVARVCGKNLIPLYAADVDSVPRGAIAALAIDYYRLGRQTGGMAERIFNGAEPATMPVESQRELRLHINLKAASKMGVQLPMELILAADAVFESFPQ
jgi:putative ABC transport system substrate-binding protein